MVMPTVCGRCHPPVSPKLVVAWLGESGDDLAEAEEANNDG